MARPVAKPAAEPLVWVLTALSCRLAGAKAGRPIFAIKQKYFALIALPILVWHRFRAKEAEPA